MARSVGVTRAQAIAVAAELADQVGYEQLTLANVATQVGIKLPSLYNHIDGLPALRRELALLGTRLLGEQLARAAIGCAGDDAVAAVAQAYRAFVLEHPGLYAATVRAPAPGDAEHHALADAALAVIVTILGHYRLAGDDLVHAARGLRSIAHGFATIEQAGGFGIALDRDESYRRLIQAYLVGLRA